MELRDEYLVCYSNHIESVGLRKRRYDHQLTNKAYLSDITERNISPSFTHKMAAKINWHRYGTKLHYCQPMYRLLGLLLWSLDLQITLSCNF